jgi:diguanylate cyclase (GGDEF)-like protein
MIGNKSTHHRNLALFILISIFYFIQVLINILIEGLASIFPPAFLFIVFGIIVGLMIQIKVNPKITMYAMISFIYIYFYYLLNDSPYLVNYLFMWLALPLSAIYQNSRVIVISGIASIILTIYTIYYPYNEVILSFFKEDFIYLVLFGVFLTILLLVFIYKYKEANKKMQELAYHDPLTGAGNRLLLKEKFDVMRHSKVHSIGLLFMDMNGFKKINDTYGHEVGDQLLEIIVLRLNDVVRETDVLCRVGGDEFVILSSNINNLKLENNMKRIQAILEKPMVLNHQRINVSASIGWSYTTDVSDADLEKMIKEADIAMYRAKGSQLITNH